MVSYVLSVVTREYSWMDRIWSVTPAVYAIYVAGSLDFASTRLNVLGMYGG